MNERRKDMHSESDHDPAISALYRRASDMEPPDHLDQAILAEAKRAARRYQQSWLLPVSTAAVVVIGLSLVLKMTVLPDFNPKPDGIPFEQPTSEQPPNAGPARPAAQKSARLSPSAKVPAQDAAAPSRKATPVPVPNAKRSTLTAPEARVLPYSDDVAPPPTRRLHKDAASSLGDEPEAAGAASMPKKAMKEPKPQSARAPLPQPEVWLKQIRELLAQGKHSRAKEQLEVFKRYYPDYLVPKDLESL